MISIFFNGAEPKMSLSCKPIPKISLFLSRDLPKLPTEGLSPSMRMHDGLISIIGINVRPRQTRSPRNMLKRNWKIGQKCCSCEVLEFSDLPKRNRKNGRDFNFNLAISRRPQHGWSPRAQIRRQH